MFKPTAVGLNIKGGVLMDNFTESLTPPAPIEDSEGGNRILPGPRRTDLETQFSLMDAERGRGLGVG